MRIRFKNPFLATVGSIFGIIDFFYPSLFCSFMFGVCFGLILRNYLEERNGDN